MPPEFITYMEYSRNLKFDEQPDYKHLMKLFEGVLRGNDIDPEDMDFDWDNKGESFIKRKFSQSPSNMKYLRTGSEFNIGGFEVEDEKKNYTRSPQLLRRRGYTMVKRKDTVIDLIKLDSTPTKSSIRGEYAPHKKKKVSFKTQLAVFYHDEEGKLTSQETKDANLKDGLGKYEKSKKINDIFESGNNNVTINHTTNNIINNYTTEEGKKDNCMIF